MQSLASGSIAAESCTQSSNGAKVPPSVISEDDIAEQFVSARLAGRGLPAYPGLPPASLEQAYKIQDAGISRMHDTVAGWKVGRIMPPMSAEFGADRLAGPIFLRSVQYASSPESTGKACIGRTYPTGFGAAEAEFLLHVGTAPKPGQQKFSIEEAAAIIDRVHVGLEIASSPLPTINDLGPAVTVSDFGNNNGLVIGPEIPGWRESSFADWTVQLFIDQECAGQGSANAFPDGPMGSVRFLLELLAQRGISLPAGSWISSGAITGVHPVRKGQTVKAQFADRFTTSCLIDSVQG